MMFKGIEFKQNWFMMPNEWTDIAYHITSLAELKVVEYVIRHTWESSVHGPPISIMLDEIQHGRRKRDGSRMDRGTGLDKAAVVDGVQRGVSHGFLIANKTDVRLIVSEIKETEGSLA